MKKSKGSKKKSKPDVPPSDATVSKRRKGKHLDPAEKETLEDLLERLGIPEGAWDILVVGDGSGSNWNREAGWASVSMERLVWTGCMNYGTVNFAEIMAYLQPLNWLAAREEDRRSKGRVRRQAYRVHIVTDSDYCRMTGNGDNRMMARNGALWAAFDIFVRQGFVLTWHWIPRDGAALNSYCDKLSKMARLLTKKYNLQERMEAQQGDDSNTVYDVNPSG